MTSPMGVAVHDAANNPEIRGNPNIKTIHRIYRDDNDDEIILRDPVNRRSFINKSAYAKLHRSLSTGNKRHSVDNLKGRFESLVKQNTETPNQRERKNQTQEVKEAESNNQVSDTLDKAEPVTQLGEKLSENNTATEAVDAPNEFTPASYGYPKTAKLRPPLIKPVPIARKNVPKDENSNLVKKNSESSDADEVPLVLRQSTSEESIDIIAKELSNFTMDGKTRERKRVGSFRKLFMGSLFSKDKKKKEEDKIRTKNGDSIMYNDNIRNESNFSRKSPQRLTIPVQATPVNNYNDQQNRREQEAHEDRVKELEDKYAELHVNRFNQIRQTFTENKQDYLPMDCPKKKSISDYISAPVNKYIDTSSSASTESERPNNGVLARDTPPRAQETYQNFKLVRPKAAIPINSERSLPNQADKCSPRTIERNLNKSNSKDYPDKADFSSQDDTYGTVFDSLEYATARNGELKPVNSPKSFETTKLRLPPNREIYDLQPRVKSPIPTNQVSTEKIIATELLKNSRSPTPPKRTVSRPPDDGKPPISPKPVPLPKPTAQPDRIVTNAVVHAPRRAQTPIDNRTYTNVQNLRASTPVDLRMSAALKLSPQKEDIRRSVEEYYWKELKKIKEEEDQKLYLIPYGSNGYYDEQARVRRSRSLSPSSHRAGRRNLSLPREERVVQNYVDYGRVPQQSIPEERALVIDGRVNRQLFYQQNFVRNNPERRSVDSLQRPIFRRGSLTKPEVYERDSYNKRVSFSSSMNPQQVWPTRNGFTQSPPQRRVDKIDSELEDEVFMPNPQMEPIYGTRYVQNEPVYSNRALEQFRAQQAYENARRQQQLMNYQQMGPRRLSMDSIPRSRQDIYVTRNQLIQRPLPNLPPREMIDPYNHYPNNSQLSLQHNPIYSSRQSITDSNYGQKQVSVRNKFCDIYGQIHDQPQTGIVMGRLQQSSPMAPPRQSYTQPPAENFVRGSRLTASANDVGKRHVDPRYCYETNLAKNYDNRPLPKKPLRPSQISDTESGSDASEIQRIMQTKSKSKKRGFFGK